MTEPIAPTAPAPDASAPAAPAAPAAPPAAPEAWYATHPNEEVRNWAANKNYADPNVALESAYNLEKMVGFDKAGRTLVLPKDDSSPEEKKAFYSKLGVPDAVDAYELPVPEGQDAAFSKTAAEWMLKHNVPKAAAQGIAKDWNDFQAAQAEAQQIEASKQSDREMSELMGEWGDLGKAKVEVGKRAAMQFIPAKDDQERTAKMEKIESVLGTRAFMELWAGIGEKIGEHKMHGDGDGGGLSGMTPMAARGRIAELKSNPEWVAKRNSGDKTAAKELSDLHKIAYPETQQ